MYVMKTKKSKTEKSTIEQLREIRDSVSVETKNMTFAELKNYIDKQLSQKSLHPVSTWR
jgi:RNase adaptor protein for sRNA GlmZ degradation